MVILDERSMFGVGSVAAVHAAWEDRLAQVNAARAEQRLAPLVIVDRSSEIEVYAYVNHSRWVVDCPCGAGVYCWPDHPRACCLECFTIVRPLFPPKSVTAEAIPVLAERSDPATRNWLHHTTPAAGDPKRLDAGRWAEHGSTGPGTGWESVTRLRNENLLLGGLSGDGIDVNVITNPRSLLPNDGRSVTRRDRLDSASVELPDEAQTPPTPAPPGQDH